MLAPNLHEICTTFQETEWLLQYVLGLGWRGRRHVKAYQPPQDEDHPVPEQHRQVHDDQAQAGEGEQDAPVLLELEPQEVRKV